MEIPLLRHTKSRAAPAFYSMVTSGVLSRPTYCAVQGLSVGGDLEKRLRDHSTDGTGAAPKMEAKAKDLAHRLASIQQITR